MEEKGVKYLNVTDLLSGENQNICEHRLIVGVKSQ